MSFKGVFCMYWEGWRTEVVLCFQCPSSRAHCGSIVCGAAVTLLTVRSPFKRPKLWSQPIRTRPSRRCRWQQLTLRVQPRPPRRHWQLGHWLHANTVALT